LDLLLLTQGWRDFEWKYKSMNYPPETGFTISGRVRKKFADVPVVNSIVNIAIFKSGKPGITTVRTDSAGRFNLTGVEVTGNAKLIASVTGDKDNLKGWLLLDSVRYTPAIVTNNIANTKFIQNNDQFINNDQLIIENQLIKKYLHTFIQQAEIKNSIRKQYQLSDTIRPGEVTIVAIRSDAPESARARSRQYLMGTPDQELIITPEEQVYNNAFQLVATKYLSGRLFQAIGINPKPLPASSLSHEMQNPLYMINGMVVGIDDVKALSISSVERIDVLDNMASYAVFGGGNGDNPIDGVISIILKSDFAISYTSVFHSVNIKFSGYTEPRVFYSPKHYTKLESDYKPDLRTTLLWEPNIKVRNNKEVVLNFFNADNPSKIKVIVEGITTSGIPVTAKTEYEVK
ncbi:MAG: carboxypeptidase-like regulatory domain-containing protein, partial [Bacteroidota bacterium]